MPAFTYPEDQCDVRDRERLKRYREHATRWFDWLHEDKDHAISRQISDLMWHDAVFRVLNEARRLDGAEATASRAGLLAQFIDQGYVSSQVLGISKLVEKSPNDPNTKKGVISLRRVVDELAANRDLFTREIFVAHDGLPYDYAAVEQAHREKLFAHHGTEPVFVHLATQGPEAFDSAARLHGFFDRLSGIKPEARTRDDRLPDKLFDTLVKALDDDVFADICTLRHKRLAHAADAVSRLRSRPRPVSDWARPPEPIGSCSASYRRSRRVCSMAPGAPRRSPCRSPTSSPTSPNRSSARTRSTASARPGTRSRRNAATGCPRATQTCWACHDERAPALREMELPLSGQPLHAIRAARNAEGRRGLLWRARTRHIGWRKDLTCLLRSTTASSLARRSGRARSPCRPPRSLPSTYVTRKLNGWKQATLADMAGVSLSTVERVERGEPVRPAALEKIGASFGYPAGYYTEPRRTLTAEQMASETYAHTAFVEVAPLKTQLQARRLAACGHLAVAPNGDVSVDDPFCTDLIELIIDLEVRFALPRVPKSRLDGVRPVYQAIFAHLQTMRRVGLDVVAGVLQEPERDPATYGVIAVARRATHPGLHARKLLVIDRRQVTGQLADEDVA